MQTSKVIDSLRFPMAVLVVLIHSYMTGVGLVGKLLYDVITRVAVPTFFLISGFLFYKRLEQWKWDVWKIKVKKRVWTLVVPYFVWISLRVVWDRMMEIIIQMHKGGVSLDDCVQILFGKVYLYGFYVACVPSSLGTDWLGNEHILSMPLHVPFWFIRDLIVMVTLSPLIWFLMKKAWIIVLPILALAFVSNIWPSVPGMSINAVFFFSLGGWFSINGRDMVNNMVKMKIIGPLLCLIFLMTIIAVPDIKDIVLPWFILAGIISAFGLADSFVNRNHTVKPLLVRSTFFIFAFHVFVLHSINIVLQLFDIVLPQSILSLNIQYVVNTVMAVCLSVVVYAFIEKRMPRVKIILTGK